MNERIAEKLSILADAAKYDVSCASSGSKRENKNKGWVMQKAWASVMHLPKMAVVFRSLKFFLPTTAFLIVHTA
jgi:predicted DNA-binding helix-hairpin-helix protein